jgi:hypothetical protein
MLSWVVDVAGTFALSLVSAYGFLRLRCRGIGPAFGPRARPWACLIVLGTALVSTAVGLAIVAASHHIGTAYAGLIVPSGLWLGQVPTQRNRQRAAWLAPALGRLYDRMGDDMQNWCDTRLLAASEKPQWISAEAKYYSDQVEGRIKDSQARAELSRWRESIMHKINIVRLIGLDTTTARLRAALQSHPSTQNLAIFADTDLRRLADRLQSDAQNELHLFLTHVYRLGYHKLLIYPFRPSAQRR